MAHRAFADFFFGVPNRVGKRESIFWRGALRNDVQSDVPYLPGTGPLQGLTDNSSGFTAGYTATLRPTLLNSFHWGYTRQSFGNPGNTNSPVISFRGLNDNSLSNNSTLAYVYSRSYVTPVNNFVDDLTWTKGNHTFQFGTNVRFIRNPRTSFLNSFPNGVTNSSGLNTAGIANTSSPLDAGNAGFPGVKRHGAGCASKQRENRSRKCGSGAQRCSASGTDPSPRGRYRPGEFAIGG